LEIYVGGVGIECVEEDLRKLFSQYGEVTRVAIITDRDTRYNRGFAFCTMPDDAQADTAMRAINGMKFQGQALRVNKSLSTRAHTSYKTT